MNRVTRRTLRADAIAALTNAAIVMPQGVAFAMVAGLPPQYGLYTAMITAVVAGFWGSSMVMVSGPTTAISALLFATLSPVAAPESEVFLALALALTILIGLLQVAAGVARLGGLISFISHSVIVGFTAAAALLIACSQLGPALGVQVERGGSVVERLLQVVEHSDQINPTACVIAIASLFSIVLCQHLSRHIPAYLVALAVGGFAGQFFGAEDHGITMFSALPSVLPSFNVPAASIGQIVELIPGAIALAVVGLLEAISIGRAFATRREEKYDTNQEIVGQGLSNIFGGLLSCYAGSGSFTRSGLNAESGAQTPLSAIFAAVWLLLLLLLLAPLVVYIPVPAMAGIILYVAWRLIKFSEIAHILRSKRETTILLATFFVGIIIELEYSIVVGVVLSLVFFLYSSSHPFVGVGAPMLINGERRLRNAELNKLPQCPKISIRRVQGQIFFGSVDELESDFSKISNDHPNQTTVVLILQGIESIDLAGADFLNQQIQRAKRNGGKVFLVVLYPSLISALERFGTLATLGRENLFHSKRDAIAYAIGTVPSTLCASCKQRVFSECSAKAGASRGC